MSDDDLKQHETTDDLSGPQRRAAELLAEDELTDAEIAARVRVGRVTLWRWKQEPAFRKVVRREAARLGSIEQRRAIARRTRRVASLDDRWQEIAHRRAAMLEVIAERAEDPEMAAIPGGRTGLLIIKDRKEIGEGDSKTTVVKVAVDVALLREIREAEKELREHEKQAAQELGQWTEQVAVAATEEPRSEEEMDGRLAEASEAIGLLLDYSRRCRAAADAGAGPVVQETNRLPDWSPVVPDADQPEDEG
jgi:hypothetical protein